MMDFKDQFEKLQEERIDCFFELIGEDDRIFKNLLQELETYEKELDPKKRETYSIALRYVLSTTQKSMYEAGFQDGIELQKLTQLRESI
jgi:hypothetical protein